jgi:hypothetical protein
MGMYEAGSTNRGTPQQRYRYQHYEGEIQRQNLRTIQGIMKKRAKRASDEGFSMICGRQRHKPWEQKATIVLRLSQETYQRIRRLSLRNKCNPSQAAELLMRTEESEKIEPTMPIDYSHLQKKGNSYTVLDILNLP